MAYDINQANDSKKIAEQEYAHDDEIRFTNFTSCIGIIVRISWTLTAVHLVVVGRDGGAFDDNAVNTVLGILGNEYEEALMIGHINDIWAPNLPKQMAALRAKISHLTEVELGDGKYGAKVGNREGAPFIEWYRY